MRSIQAKLAIDVQPRTFEYGNLFETYIVNELLRISDYFRKDWRLSFLRTANDVEVDVILETPCGQTLAIEIKAKDHPSPVDFRAGFAAFSRFKPAARNICVCTAPNRRIEENVEIIPWQDFLLEMENLVH